MRGGERREEGGGRREKIQFFSLVLSNQRGEGRGERGEEIWEGRFFTEHPESVTQISAGSWGTLPAGSWRTLPTEGRETLPTEDRVFESICSPHHGSLYARVY